MTGRSRKANIDWKRAHAELAAERDREIRRLAAEGCGKREIAARVGCAPATVYELLREDRRQAYNQRRREHWHTYVEQRKPRAVS